MKPSKITRNGITTTQTLGTDNFEKFTVRGMIYYQYDYRAPDGELFSTIKPSLRQCRDARDKWLADK